MPKRSISRVLQSMIWRWSLFDVPARYSMGLSAWKGVKTGLLVFIGAVATFIAAAPPDTDWQQAWPALVLGAVAAGIKALVNWVKHHD